MPEPSLWSRLHAFINLAHAILHQSISVETLDVRLEHIPGQQLTIYHGGFSTSIKCYLVRQSAEPDVVVVKCPKHIYDQSCTAKIRKIFEREARTWKKLDHPNILPLIAITYQFGPIPCLITPWMSEGTLTDFLRCNHNQLSLERKFGILHGIVSGLHYLHHSGIVHGDLTGSNILLDREGRVCIADFGLSYSFHEADESIPSNICAPRWAATELFVHPDLEVSCPVPTTNCDIYSFGCVVLQVLSGRLPFSTVSKSTHIIILKYEGKNPLDKRPSDLSVIHWQFLQAAWSKRPENRPSSDQALAFVEGELERYRRSSCLGDAPKFAEHWP